MDRFFRNSMEKMVYDKIKNAIVSKLLVPGTQLVEQTLTTKFNISRTPIRNAFKKLEQDGFVTIIPNRGAFIIQPKKEEILDAFTLRTELECTAIKLGLPKITKQDVEELITIENSSIDALKENDIINYLEYNKQFHLFLAKKSTNKFLIDFLEKLLEQIDVYLILYDTYYNVDVESITGIKEHQEIIKLIKEKNVTELESYLRYHLKNSLDDIKIDKLINKTIDEIF